VLIFKKIQRTEKINKNRQYKITCLDGVAFVVVGTVAS
jgi:hypothetical protein